MKTVKIVFTVIVMFFCISCFAAEVKMKLCPHHPKEQRQSDWGELPEKTPSFSTMTAADDPNYRIIEIPHGTVIEKDTRWEGGNLVIHLWGDMTIPPNVMLSAEGINITYELDAKIINYGTVEMENVWFHPEWIYLNHPWTSARAAIVFKEEGSAELRNCLFAFFATAISIEDSYGEVIVTNSEWWYCSEGVSLQCPHSTTKISNCLFQGCLSSGVSVYLAGLSGVDTPDPNTYVEITNCDFLGEYGWSWETHYGIYASGVNDPNEAGTIVTKNNIIAGSFSCGIGLYNGWFKGSFYNAFYNNIENWNEGNPFFTEGTSLIVSSNPFEGSEYSDYSYPPALKQHNNPLVNGCSEYIWDTPWIGTTTSADGEPDSQQLDFGCHWPTNKSNAGTMLKLLGDLNEDSQVDFLDLMILSRAYLVDFERINKQVWWEADYSSDEYYRGMDVIIDFWDLKKFFSDYYWNFYYFAKIGKWWKFDSTKNLNRIADLNSDGFVNSLDFALFALNWQKRIEKRKHPDISVSIEKDPNYPGDIELVVKGLIPTSQYVFVSIDGESVAAEYCDAEKRIDLDTTCYRNGNHYIQAIVVDSNDGLVTLSETVSENFDNFFYNVRADYSFYPGENYQLSFCSKTTEPIDVKLIDFINGQVIWLDQRTGPLVNLTIPGSVFNGKKICELSIKESSGESSGIRATAQKSSKEWNRITAKKFKKEDFDGVWTIILLPKWKITKIRKPIILAEIEACEYRGLSWDVVNKYDVNTGVLTYLLSKYSQVKPLRKYVSYHGDGNSQAGADPEREIEGVQRTHLECFRKQGSKHILIPMFSFTRQSVNAQPLPNKGDEIGFDVHKELQLRDTNKIIGFWADACKAGLYPDLAFSLGMWSTWNHGNKDQAYFSFRQLVLTDRDPLIEGIDKRAGTLEGLTIFWTYFGRYDYNAEKALEATWTKATSNNTLISMWGLNRQLDLDDEDGDDNFVRHGVKFSLQTYRFRPK